MIYGLPIPCLPPATMSGRTVEYFTAGVALLVGRSWSILRSPNDDVDDDCLSTGVAFPPISQPRTINHQYASSHKHTETDGWIDLQ